MVKKLSNSAQLKAKLNKAIIDTIVSMGGSASRKSIISAIENSNIFNDWESEVLRSNKIRWITALDIQSNELAKSGQIVKKSGVWIALEQSQSTRMQRDSVYSKTKTEKSIDTSIGKSLQNDNNQFDDLLDTSTMLIIRGKLTPQPDDKEGLEAKMLRNAFLKYERKKAVESIDTSKKFEEFYEKLVISKQTNAPKKELSWWALIKLLFALMSGLIIGMMMPMQMATKGGENGFLKKLFTFDEENVSSEIILDEDSPNSFAWAVIQTATSEGLITTMSQSNGQIELIIKGLVSKDVNQMGTKSRLNLPIQVEGKVRLIIRQKRTQ